MQILLEQIDFKFIGIQGFCVFRELLNISRKLILSYILVVYTESIILPKLVFKRKLSGETLCCASD